MKSICFTTILLFINLGMFSQVPSNCNVPAVLQAAYNDDVHYLALTRIFQTNSTYTSSITIPKAYSDSIWEGLAAIFNATSISERDSVFDIYCIHEHDAPVPNGVLVMVDTSYSWTQAWQNNTLTTGYTQLDNLLSFYGFKLNSYSSLSNYAHLSTNQKINIYALNDSIKKFNGVKGSDVNANLSYGNDINYSTNANNKEFEFSLGCGDCPAGCTGRYIWKFSVSPNCSVLFKGIVDNRYNQPCPSPVNCNLTINGIQETANINANMAYPNPNNGIFTIEIEESDYELIITSILGEKLFHSTHLQRANSTIDLSSQPAGVYFLQLKTERETVTQKLIIHK